MTTLRYLVIYSFLAGMFFDSFISSMVRHHIGYGAIFLIVSIADLWVALKYYDKAKVNK